MRSRGYCYTLNNPTAEEVEVLKTIDCRYHVMGEETGENGTPHIQGYLYFKSVKSFSQVKKLIRRAHIEPQKGSFEKAIEYCKKDGVFSEYGEPPMTQKRKGDCNIERYEDAWKKAKSGNLEEIDADIRIRHLRTLEDIVKKYGPSPPHLENLTNEWYWGETGTGKTFKARTENPEAYIKNCNKWWCGYDNQEVVIIDEFSPPHSVLSSHLKIWADHYPFCAETKGGSMLARPQKIIITSNYHPSEIFLTDQELEPILRRFRVTHFNKPL